MDKILNATKDELKTDLVDFNQQAQERVKLLL